MQLVGDASSCYSLLVDQLFRQQAAAHPHLPAVTFNHSVLTYRELSDRTDTLAIRLKELGVGPGVLVAICTERCLEMIPSMLAVFRSGAAYLPVDAAFPPDRVSFMLADAKPLVVMTQSHLCAKLNFNSCRVICLDEALDRDQPQITSDEFAIPDYSLDSLAYILYTSGSTGQPKGVQITHRALTNLLVTVANDLSIGESDIFLATSTISFDISVFELLAPLISGAHLVIASRSAAMSGELLTEEIRRHSATMLQATPSGWRILLASGWAGHPGLKMLTAGEPLDLALANSLLERGASLWNLYGPTEATIYATGTQITAGQTKITIGRPLQNYTAYILDDQGREVVPGALGELHLGGIGIASGYLNRPELTAEKFIPDAFDPTLGTRLYRTGDLARLLANGEIELLGRVDNQIKLRGHRIELGEIEAMLESHPSVNQCVVKLFNLSELDQRLVAYVVIHTSFAFDEMALRDYAARNLPSYMVPYFVKINAFALNTSGKIDRNALQYSVESNPAHQAAFSSLEDLVLHSWSSLLGIPTLAADVNFFQAGGHSLLAMRACADLGNTLGLKLPVSLLIEAPTARTFANRIQDHMSLQVAVQSDGLVLMQPRGSLKPLYVIHHLLGDILVYRALADCFAPDRPVAGIQAPGDFLARSRPYPLTTLASEYLNHILAHQREGPFHLVGYSSGAALAFEMARQLTQLCHQVGLLALIDGEMITGPPRLPKLLDPAKVVFRKLCKVIFKFADETRDGVRMFVARRVGYVRFLLRIRKLERSVTAETEITLEQALKLSENAYVPQPYSGSALLIRFQDEASRFGPNPLLGWDGLIESGIEAVDVPGGHITGMNPDRAAHIADILKDRLAKFESSLPNKNRLPTEAGSRP